MGIDEDMPEKDKDLLLEVLYEIAEEMEPADYYEIPLEVVEARMIMRGWKPNGGMLH